MKPREKSPRTDEMCKHGKTVARSITLVRPMQGARRTTLMPVETVLDNLSAEALALLRFAPFECGHCGGRVNLRVQSVDASGTTSGHRAYFAHAVDEGAACPVVTPQAPCADDLGAALFRGKQEGHRHRQLKNSLLAAASADPAVTFGQAEVYLTNRSTSRRPDVVLRMNNHLVCFDIQLAPPPRVTISGRTAFYAPAGFKHVWVLDGERLDCVNLQPFQDLLWRQGGRALAFDEGCLNKSLSSKTLAFKLVTITDEGDRISTQWSWIEGRELLACFGLLPCDTGLTGDLLSQGFLSAFGSSDSDALKRWYDAVGPDLGLPVWKAFITDGLRPLIGAITSVRAGEVRDGSARQASEVTAVFHNALATGVFDGRHHWTPVLEAALEMPTEKYPLCGFGPKTAKLIQRAKQSHDPAQFARRMDLWRPWLARLFPTLPLP